MTDQGKAMGNEGPIKWNDGAMGCVLLKHYLATETNEDATVADLAAAGFIRKPTPEPGEPVGGKLCPFTDVSGFLCSLPIGHENLHQYDRRPVTAAPVPAETAGEAQLLKEELQRVYEVNDVNARLYREAQSALTRAEGRVRELEAERAELDAKVPRAQHRDVTDAELAEVTKLAIDARNAIITANASTAPIVRWLMWQPDRGLAVTLSLLTQLEEAKAEREALRLLADKWTQHAASIRSDGDGLQWTYAAEAREECADELRDALRAQPPLVNPPEASNNGWTDEQRAALGQVADALERALPSLTDEERFVALNSIYRRRYQPPLASSVVADEATTGEVKEEPKQHLLSICGCAACQAERALILEAPLTGEEGKAERVDYVTRAELLDALDEALSHGFSDARSTLKTFAEVLESRAAKERGTPVAKDDLHDGKTPPNL